MQSAALEILPSKCDWCPRLCGANRAAGERGVCGADDSLMVARSALHFWEEPPVSGEAGSGTIFFSHCPLHCSYCQNAVIAAGDVGVEVTLDRLVEMMFELADQGALNINFVTPTHYAQHIKVAVAEARSRGLRLPIVWNTSGYERTSVIRELEGTVDVFLTDLKYLHPETAKRYSAAPTYVDEALSALDAMVEITSATRYEGDRMTQGVIVRHLMLPGCLEESAEIVRYVHDRYGDRVRMSLMNQYTPVLVTAADSGDPRAANVLKRCPELAEYVSNEEYEALLDFADELGVQDYFWQEGGACEESFIPLFDLTGVRESAACAAASQTESEA